MGGNYIRISTYVRAYVPGLAQNIVSAFANDARCLECVGVRVCERSGLCLFFVLVGCCSCCLVLRFVECKRGVFCLRVSFCHFSRLSGFICFCYASLFL